MNLEPKDRLIVAADFKCADGEGWRDVEVKVMRLVHQLEDTGVYIKVNSILRCIGYQLIEKLHERGVRMFADLKLNDIPATLEADALLLQEFKPELLTVMCSAYITGMDGLGDLLPDTEVLGVTVLTSMDDDASWDVYGRPVKKAVKQLASIAAHARIGGIVASAKEIPVVQEVTRDHKKTINTPGIRPAWSIVASDDQNKKRVMTPAQAIMAGADRIIIGRPIVQADDPRGAVQRTLQEIESATHSAP